MRSSFGFLFLLLAITVASAQTAPKLDTAVIDSALGRTGTWSDGNYVVSFYRPELGVSLEGVRLAPGHIHSFATFTGTGDKVEMMGDVCALSGEVTSVVEKLRSAGIHVTGIHDHFLGETPQVMFVHFLGRGSADTLANAFRTALGATTVSTAPLVAPSKSSPPVWRQQLEAALGRHAAYSPETGLLGLKVVRGDMNPGVMDFWNASSLNFQETPQAKVLAIGDLALTEDEIDPALTALTQHRFQIAALHNHTTDEQPRLFFLHFWKLGEPTDIGEGLKATLEKIHTRSLPSS
jgi:hypothetical protein